MVADEDLASPEQIQDPHPYFHRLRREDPVHWSDIHHAWILTRYDDVAAAFRDLRLSAERVPSMLPRELAPEDRAAFSPILRLLANWMVFRDPPAHARLRRLARSAFAVRSVENLRAMIGGATNALLDRLTETPRADLMRDFAVPLPSTVIAKMLGVPDQDHEQFRQWSEDLEPMVFGGLSAADRRERARRSLLDLEGYFRRLLEAYRRAPGDNLLTALSQAEEMGDVLTGDEVVATCILLLFAGHETTSNLIGNAFLALDRNPGEKRKLAANPALAPSAVEEFLRFEGPTKIQVRLALADCEVRGRRIRKSQRVFLVQAAANRDPERFVDPDRLDLERRDSDHLAFGFGIHHCLGAPLARLEAQVVFSSLLSRLPGLHVTTDHPDWRPNVLGRGLKSLPVALDGKT